MAERFNQRVQVGVQNLRSGAERGLMGLASQMQGFVQQRTQDLNVKAQEEGQLAGQQAGLDLEAGDKPEFKEERFIGGVRARAFNAGLRDAYIAGVSNDARENLNRIELENPTDVAAYDNAAQAWANGVMSEVDPQSLPAIQSGIEKSISMGRTRVQESGFKVQREAARQELNVASGGFADDAARFARNGDTEAAQDSFANFRKAIESKVKGKFITPEKAESEITEASREVNEQEIRGKIADIVEEQGIDAAFDQLEGVAGTVPKGWTPDQWDGFIQDAQGDLNRKAARAKADRKELAVANELNESVARGHLFMNPDIPADPAKGGQDFKDVSNAYNAVSLEWSALPIQDQINNNVEFVKNTGIVPEALMKNIAATARSGNPEQVSLMAEVVGKISEQPYSAQALKGVSDESRAFYLQVNDSLRNQVDPEQAIEIARKAAYGRSAADKEVARVTYAGAQKSLGSDLQSMVDDEYDNNWLYFVGSPPDTPPMMQAEFNLNTEKFLSMTNNDIDQAKKLAFEATKKTWARTVVGGEDRFMLNAPEAFYSQPGIENDWIPEQFNEEMEAAGIPDAQIQADPTTLRSGKPTYLVMTAVDGVVNTAFDEVTGLARRWAPDFKETEQYRELAGLDPIGDARELRARRDERRAAQLLRIVRGRVKTQEFTAPVSEERRVEAAIGNLLAVGKIDKVEAEQMREAFEVN